MSALSCEISSSQSSDDEDSRLLGCYAVLTGKRLPAFRRHLFVLVLSVEQFKNRDLSVAIDQSRWHSASKHLHLLEHPVVGCVLKYANQPYDYVTDCTTEKTGVRM
jgi:hypothetical protein